MSSRIVKSVSPQTPDDENSIIQPNPKILAISQAVSDQIQMARFRGSPMLMTYQPFPHWQPINQEMFKDVAYPIVQAVTRSNISDAWEYLSHTVEDLTPFENHILFGVPGSKDDHPDAVAIVWDMDDCSTLAPEGLADQCIWRSPYSTIPQKAIFSGKDYGPIKFIMDLACGDPDMYHDIMLSIAPLIMKEKPTGVVWWVGDGANGKSTLMDALYDIFPDQLASVNIKDITEGKDLPSLNGRLANVVRESSEGRIDDTQHYKSLGSHESFPVHKFFSQAGQTINANMHHIFSANQIPVFNDKGHSARRRTHIIPFNAHFESDPLFKKRTFTPEFYGRLIAEMCKYAREIKNAEYKFQWKSTITTGTKLDYDENVNSAESYIKELVSRGIVAFDSFDPISREYEKWCIEHGANKLGARALSDCAKRAGFSRRPVRMGDRSTLYMLPTVVPADLQEVKDLKNPWSIGGTYTQTGFQVADPEPVIIPPFHEPKEPETVPPDDDPPKVFRKGEW